MKNMKDDQTPPKLAIKKETHGNESRKNKNNHIANKRDDK